MILNLTCHCLLGLSLAATADPEVLRRFEFVERQMGVSFKIVLYAPDESTANKASRAAFDRIAGLDRIMSDYNPDSELSRLGAAAGSGRRVPLSPELFQVLSRAATLSEQSNGAFDVTVGPLVREWRRARGRKKLPDDRTLREARQAVGFQWLRLDPAEPSVELLRPGMRLDLGGIAKGFAADEALRVLRSHGISRALVDGSGDVAVSGSPPGKPGWQIAVAPLERPDGPPSQMLTLAHQAVATSGDAFQYVEIAGTRYSHLIDPATGIGLTRRSSVTVLATDGITADGLASAVSVLGPEEGLRLIESLDGVEAFVVEQAADGTVRTCASSGFPVAGVP